MVNERMLMEEIQAIEFAILDMNLYLDVNPQDKQMIMKYNAAIEQMNKLKEQYVKMFGPIQWQEMSRPDSFTWIDRMWPWEVR